MSGVRYISQHPREGHSYDNPTSSRKSRRGQGNIISGVRSLCALMMAALGNGGKSDRLHEFGC